MPRHSCGLLSCLAAALPLGACSDGTDEPRTPPVASVTIVSMDSVLSPMESSQLQAEVEDTAGSLILRTITWSVQDPQLASISALGLLTADWGGSTYAIAEVDGVRDSLPLRITRSFTAVSVGPAGACAIAYADSAAWCWGSPAGSASSDPNGLPTLVDGAHRWIGISVSRGGACGLIVGGAAWCWGDDSDNHLGVGVGGPVVSPAPLLGGYQYSAIEIGGTQACGIALAGQGVCWGTNTFGEVGDSTQTLAPPTVVHGGITWTSIQADNTVTCGLDQSAAAYCWGYDAFGYFGVDTMRIAGTAVLVPAPVQTNLLFSTLAVGGFAQCGLEAGGVAWCWGDNTQGEVGKGDAHDAEIVRVPTPVIGGLHFLRLAAGDSQFCGLSSADSTAWCWGGGLGLGTSNPIAGTPTPVVGGHRFVALAAGFNRSCGLTAGGAIWCWGLGFMGDGAGYHSPAVITPVRVRDP